MKVEASRRSSSDQRSERHRSEDHGSEHKAQTAQARFCRLQRGRHLENANHAAVHRQRSCLHFDAAALELQTVANFLSGERAAQGVGRDRKRIGEIVGTAQNLAVWADDLYVEAGIHEGGSWQLYCACRARRAADRDGTQLTGRLQCAKVDIVIDVALDLAVYRDVDEGGESREHEREQGGVPECQAQPNRHYGSSRRT